ncbi:MAG: prepilin-type N-terminal cleavage/methylation domain-containing protein [Piscinibacter sp.]|nr:prepilin-type N-terminal cleavage/methylation domain-containing protein [Piscinibacter sp.]
MATRTAASSAPRAAQAGFTLVEVLVALLVLALMASMAWQGVDGITRARDTSQGQIDRTLRINAVVGQWESDLAKVQDTGAVPALNFDGVTLRLTRASDEGMQVIAWSLRPDQSGSTLLRWAGPVVTNGAALQDSWFTSQQLQGSEPGQLRALEGVSQWQVYFYYQSQGQSSGWSNAQSTGNVTPFAGAASAPVTVQALPAGVRLVMEFAPGSGVNGPLTRDTLLGP